MGNAQTHHHLSATDVAAGHVRKKSRDDRFDYTGVVGGGDLAGSSAHRPRTASTGSKPQQQQHYDDSGPVDITARVHQKASSHQQSGAHRPRATTEVARRPPQQPQQQQHRQQQHVSVDVRSEAAAAAARAKDLTAAAARAAALADPNDKELLRERSEGGKKKMPTIFKYSGKEAKEVYVAGSFNNWTKMRMNRSTKDFVAIVDLQEGEHEYKFFADGEWVTDKAVETIENPEGIKNNVIRVHKGDFNALDALDMDSEAVTKLSRNRALAANTTSAAAAAAAFLGPNGQDEFGQEAPSTAVFEHRSGPPILPPHLLQVILNKDTPLSCEPTLLPEPNHVMINHLYALSIKDGVMVLSATNRYRKKYVTTLLYKPMGQRPAAAKPPSD